MATEGQKSRRGLTVLITSVLVLTGALVAWAVVSSDLVQLNSNSFQVGVFTEPEGAIDIEIAPAVVDGLVNDCSTVPEDSWSGGPITEVFAEQVEPQSGFSNYFASVVCLRRVDTVDTSMNLTARIANVTDIDTACSEDEDTAGDTDCGTGAPGSGEIGDFHHWLPDLALTAESCQGFTFSGNTGQFIEGSSAGIIQLSSGSNGPICIRFMVRSSNLSSDDVKLIQSDSASWDWVIEATEPA